MAVPDTDTFSMQDVVDEIGSGDDLQELFSLATGTFDPTYEGDKTNLLNFRNYTHLPTPILLEDFTPVYTWRLGPDANISGTLLGLTGPSPDAWAEMDYANPNNPDATVLWNSGLSVTGALLTVTVAGNAQEVDISLGAIGVSFPGQVPVHPTNPVTLRFSFENGTVGGLSILDFNLKAT